jgi:hypothetical protein
MEKHVKAVAALQIGFSILGILLGVAGFIVLRLVGEITNDSDADFILRIIANVVIIFWCITSIPGIIAGIGLLKRQEWARILTMILSVVELFHIPVGTAVGAYSLWAMVQNETSDLFRENKM